jgi:hypothetical protein
MNLFSLLVTPFNRKILGRLHPSTAALRAAVSLRIKSPVCMAQIQKPPKGYKNPSEAFFSPPSGKFFHISLQKVKVMYVG